MISALKRHWFLVTLVLVVVLGFTAPAPLVRLAEMAWVRNGIVAAVLFLMALPIEARQIREAVSRPVAPLTAVAIAYLFQPVVAWLLAFSLSPAGAHGLIIASIVPSTLASGVVWTRRAGGNDAIAMVVTVLTNGFCFLVAPLWLWLLLGAADDTGRWLALIPQLATLVVAPMALAQFLRRWSAIASTAGSYRVTLSTASQLGILAMVALGTARVANPAAAGEAVPTPWLEPIGITLLVILLHTLSLAAGYWLSLGLRLSRPDAIAVAISGSQKTLMIGLALAIDLRASILPLLTYHISQLFIDTFFADRMRQSEATALPHESR